MNPAAQMCCDTRTYRIPLRPRPARLLSEWEPSALRVVTYLVVSGSPPARRLASEATQHPVKSSRLDRMCAISRSDKKCGCQLLS